MSSDEELIRAHREILANRGIVAYVDVWQDDIMNYSELWQEKLIDMGAKVVKKWNKNVTHLVYKDGRPGIGFYGSFLMNFRREYGSSRGCFFNVASSTDVKETTHHSKFYFPIHVHLNPKILIRICEES